MRSLLFVFSKPHHNTDDFSPMTFDQSQRLEYGWRVRKKESERDDFKEKLYLYVTVPSFHAETRLQRKPCSRLPRYVLAPAHYVFHCYRQIKTLGYVRPYSYNTEWENTPRMCNLVCNINLLDWLHSLKCFSPNVSSTLLISWLS